MKPKFIPIILLIVVLLFATSCSEPEIQIGAEVIVEDEKPEEGGTIINIKNSPNPQNQFDQISTSIMQSQISDVS